MRSNDCDVNFERLAVTDDLEVVQDEVARRQVIPQVSNGLALGLVHWFTDGDHNGHFKPFPPSSLVAVPPPLPLQSLLRRVPPLLPRLGRRCAPPQRTRDAESAGATSWPGAVPVACRQC